MSDLMLFGVLRMPYEMAMCDELSRYQFYQRAQEAADRLEAVESSQPAPQGVAEVMEQAQVFASAWALIGGRFDRGTAVDLAKGAEAELRAMVITLVQERDALRARVAELEPDAARYRWLRVHSEYMGWDADFPAEQIDDQVSHEMAVDAAIAAVKEKP